MKKTRKLRQAEKVGKSSDKMSHCVTQEGHVVKMAQLEF